MEFITADQDGKYFVNLNTAHFLQNISGPITIIAVTGVFRCGKSTLLNKILGKISFTTSKTTKSQTKGLWLIEWMPGVLLMDAEGLGSTDADDAHDYNIFALAVLLSSVLIYNHDGAIDKNSLQALRVAGKVANMLKNQTKMKLSSTDLIWLIRNAELEMVDKNNNPCDAQTYLEDNIESNSGILELFPKRTCFALPTPSEQEKQTIYPAENYRTGFTNGIVSLSEYLKTNIAPKYIGGIVMTGPLLLVLANAVITSINSGLMLNLSNVWDAAMLAQELKAKQHAKQKIRFGDNLDVLIDVMDEYELNVIEKKDNKIMKEMASLIHYTHDQAFNHWLKSADGENIELLPIHIQNYIKPILASTITKHHQNLEEQKKLYELLTTKFELLVKEYDEMKLSREEFEKNLATQKELSQQEKYEFETKLVQSETRYSCLDTEMKDLNDELNELRSALTDSTNQSFQYGNEIKQLKNEIFILTQDNSHLKDAVTIQLTNLKEIIEKQKLNLENLKTENAKTKLDLNVAKEQNVKLSKDLETHGNLLTKLEQERQQSTRLLETQKLQMRDLEMKCAILEAKEEEASKQRKKAKFVVSEPLNIEVQWLKTQHEKDELEIKQSKEQLALLMREKMELEIKVCSQEAQIQLLK